MLRKGREVFVNYEDDIKYVKITIDKGLSSAKSFYYI